MASYGDLLVRYDFKKFNAMLQTSVQCTLQEIVVAKGRIVIRVYGKAYSE